MKNTLKISALLLITVAMLSSCKKDRLDDYTLTYDYGNANYIVSDTKDMIDLNFNNTNEARLSSTACSGATITIKNNDYFKTPDTLTIDFGTTNMWCHGKMRRGKIIAIRTAPYLNSGSTTNISFDYYYVNDHLVDGSKTVTNNGVNTDGDLEFSIEASINIALANGNAVSWTSNRSRTWIAGDNTPLDRTDDQYEISGSNNGTHSNGSFSVNITTPIVLDLSCWDNSGCARVSGVAEVTPPNGNIRTIDYGNGTCDCSQTIIVNGNTYTTSF